MLTMDANRRATFAGIVACAAFVTGTAAATGLATDIEQVPRSWGKYRDVPLAELTLPSGFGWVVVLILVAAALLWWRVVTAGVVADDRGVHVRNGLWLKVSYPYLAIDNAVLGPDDNILRRLLALPALGGRKQRWECIHLVLADGTTVRCRALASHIRPTRRGDAAIKLDILRRYLGAQGCPLTS
ncbi:MAG: hypothetical protein ACKV2O_07205 [Acidimicrobiales bacterium]